MPHSPSDKAKLLKSLLQLDRELLRLNRSFEKRTGLTLVQWKALDQLSRYPGLSATLLCRRLGVHASTLTPLLERLHKKRFVFMTSDPRDSRRKILVATRAGFELRDKARGQLDLLLENFEEQRVTSMVQLLQPLV